MKKYLATISLIALLLPQAAFACDITTGLASWYKFDEGSGSTAFDSGSQGINGTLNGGVSYTTGKIGPYATSYPGGFTNSYMTPGNIDSPGTGSFTISGWAQFNTQSSPNNYPGIITKFNTSSVGYVLFVAINGANTVNFEIADGTNAAAVTTPSAMDDGNWHQYIGVVDRTAQVMSLYVDGTLIGTSSTSGVGTLSNSQSFGTGWRGDNTGNFSNNFTGNIDDVRYYTRALSSADVACLYAYPSVAAIFNSISVSFGSFLKVLKGASLMIY